MGKLLFTIYKCNQCKNVFFYPNGYRYPETHCPNCMATGNKIKILKLIYEKKIKPSEIVFSEYSVKEVKKMKYLEVKVVKVKKKIGCRHETITWNREDKTVRCKLCGEILTWGVDYEDFFPFTGTKKISKQKGNWVNGENLDKIKFPCFCRWGTDPKIRNWIGMIQKNFWQGGIRYSLERIDRQTEESITYGVENNLEDLMRKNNIHILKGKIIIFDDTLENGKYDIDIEEE